MRPEDLIDMIGLLLEGRKYEGNKILSVEPFENTDRITDEHGVVISVSDGSEFEIYIKISEYPDGEEVN